MADIGMDASVSPFARIAGVANSAIEGALVVMAARAQKSSSLVRVAGHAFSAVQLLSFALRPGPWLWVADDRSFMGIVAAVVSSFVLSPLYLGIGLWSSAVCGVMVLFAAAFLAGRGFANKARLAVAENVLAFLSPALTEAGFLPATFALLASFQCDDDPPGGTALYWRGSAIKCGGSGQALMIVTSWVLSIALLLWSVAVALSAYDRRLPLRGRGASKSVLDTRAAADAHHPALNQALSQPDYSNSAMASSVLERAPAAGVGINVDVADGGDGDDRAGGENSALLSAANSVPPSDRFRRHADASSSERGPSLLAMSNGRTTAMVLLLKWSLVFLHSFAAHLSVWVLLVINALVGLVYAYLHISGQPYVISITNQLHAAAGSCLLWASAVGALVEWQAVRPTSAAVTFFILLPVAVLVGAGLVSQWRMWYASSRSTAAALAAASAVSVDARARAVIASNCLTDAHAIRAAETIYSQALSNRSAPALLHVLYANFLRQQRGNALLELAQLQVAERSSPSVDVLLMLRVRMREIESNDERVTSGMRAAVITRLQWEALRIEALQYTYDARLAQAGLWAALAEKEPSAQKLSDLGEQLDTAISKALNSFEQLMVLQPQSVGTAREFASFLLTILNDERRSLALLEQADDTEDVQSKRAHYAPSLLLNLLGVERPIDMALDSVCIVLASFEGSITHATTNALRALGMSKREALGMRLTALMPPGVDSLVAGLLRRLLAEGRSPITGSSRGLLLRSRAGPLVPVTAYFTAVQQSLALVFVPRRSEESHFLFTVSKNDRAASSDAVSATVRSADGSIGPGSQAGDNNSGARTYPLLAADATTLGMLEVGADALAQHLDLGRFMKSIHKLATESSVSASSTAEGRETISEADKGEMDNGSVRSSIVAIGSKAAGPAAARNVVRVTSASTSTWIALRLQVVSTGTEQSDPLFFASWKPAKHPKESSTGFTAASDALHRSRHAAASSTGYVAAPILTSPGSFRIMAADLNVIFNGDSATRPAAAAAVDDEAGQVLQQLQRTAGVASPRGRGRRPSSTDSASSRSPPPTAPLAGSVVAEHHASSQLSASNSARANKQPSRSTRATSPAVRRRDSQNKVMFAEAPPSPTGAPASRSSHAHDSDDVRDHIEASDAESERHAVVVSPRASSRAESEERAVPADGVEEPRSSRSGSGRIQAQDKSAGREHMSQSDTSDVSKQSATDVLRRNIQLRRSGLDPALRRVLYFFGLASLLLAVAALSAMGASRNIGFQLEGAITRLELAGTAQLLFGSLLVASQTASVAAGGAAVLPTTLDALHRTIDVSLNLACPDSEAGCADLRAGVAAAGFDASSAWLAWADSGSAAAEIVRGVTGNVSSGMLLAAAVGFDQTERELYTDRLARQSVDTGLSVAVRGTSSDGLQAVKVVGAPAYGTGASTAAPDTYTFLYESSKYITRVEAAKEYMTAAQRVAAAACSGNRSALLLRADPSLIYILRNTESLFPTLDVSVSEERHQSSDLRTSMDLDGMVFLLVTLLVDIVLISILVPLASRIEAAKERVFAVLMELPLAQVQALQQRANIAVTRQLNTLKQEVLGDRGTDMEEEEDEQDRLQEVTEADAVGVDPLRYAQATSTGTGASDGEILASAAAAAAATAAAGGSETAVEKHLRNKKSRHLTKSRWSYVAQLTRASLPLLLMLAYFFAVYIVNHNIVGGQLASIPQNTYYSHKRAALIQRYGMLVRQTALIPLSTDPLQVATLNATAAAASDTAAEIDRINQAILFGSEDLSLPSSLQASTAQQQLFMQDGCHVYDSVADASLPLSVVQAGFEPAARGTVLDLITSAGLVPQISSEDSAAVYASACTSFSSGAVSKGLSNALTAYLQLGRLIVTTKLAEQTDVSAGTTPVTQSCSLPVPTLKALSAAAGKPDLVPALRTFVPSTIPQQEEACAAVMEGSLNAAFVAQFSTLGSGPLLHAFVYATSLYESQAQTTLSRLRDTSLQVASTAAVAFLVITYALLVPALTGVNRQLYQIRALLLAVPIDVARAHARVLLGLYRIASEVNSGSWLRIGETAIPSAMQLAAALTDRKRTGDSASVGSGHSRDRLSGIIADHNAMRRMLNHDNRGHGSRGSGVGLV